MNDNNTLKYNQEVLNNNLTEMTQHSDHRPLGNQIDDSSLKNVGAGFVGLDWSKKYDKLYTDAGIIHEKHVLHKDKYYVHGEDGKRIYVDGGDAKEFACALANLPSDYESE